MKFNTGHAVAAIVAATCLAIPASASAMPYSPPTTTRSDAAQSGDDAKIIATTARSALAHERYYSSYGTPDNANSTFPAADFRGGDAPVDHPGASRAQPTPTTIEVVRPERTIVRGVDQALPIALAGSALALVLAMLGITLVRARLVPRPGRSH
jgi:hypothetical protein